MLRTKNGRILLAGAAGGVIAAPFVCMAVIALFISLLTGTAGAAGDRAQAVASQAGVSDTDLTAYQDSQRSTGAPWEVLASLRYEEAGGGTGITATPAPTGPQPSASPTTSATSQGDSENYSPTDSYVGPFHLARKALLSAHVDPARMTNLGSAADYVGDLFMGHLRAQKDYTTDYPLDSGRLDSADNPSSIDPGSVGGKVIAATYPRALAELPVEGMSPAVANRVFQRALAWRLGNRFDDSGTNLGVVCSTVNDPPPALATSSSPSASPTASPTGSDSVPRGPPQTLTVQTTTGQSLTLGAQQLANAATAIGVANKEGVNSNGQTAMLMTSLQESHLLILANPTVPESESNPNKQGEGSNKDSLGLYQQRAAWGTVAQRMDPVYSTQAFLGGPNGPNHGSPRGLLDIAGWQTMDPGVLAQTVQVSAYPDAYDQWLPAAATILGAVTGASCSDEYGTTDVAGNAPDEAAALLRLADAGKLILLNASRSDLENTANGLGFDSCSDPQTGRPHHILLDSDLLHLYLIMATKFVITVTNFATLHGCDPYYHPPGMATDIAAVTQISTGRSTNFHPGSAGNNPAVVADFINFVAASGPDHLGMGQQQCADHAGGSPRYQQVAFSDSCTHQHINVHQNDPQWGPYIPEKWPAGNGPTN